MKNICQIILIPILLAGCKQSTSTSSNSGVDTDSSRFPAEMVDFIPYEKNPVLTGSGADTWDQLIRERGYILRENGTYHMWYTGYRDGPDEERYLGYATSADGLEWKKYKDNPIFDSGWVEDVCVLNVDSTYYMFAEGTDDIAHMLTSTDRIHWKEHGPLDVRYTNGEPLTEGPYGTPTVWLENGVWHLFYERMDLGIWLATSSDLKKWTNLQDDPVIELGPEKYDQEQVALNQIIKYQGRYFAYYHASEYEDWRKPWTSCVAMSEDLVQWIKYPKNPIMRENKSTPILVHDGSEYRLYTMHPQVCVHFPTSKVKR
jgi:sucrose-6-phosphate hydrolase SacC (GH32 family)